MTGASLRHILGRNLKFFRNLRSLLQIELAEKAEISIPFLSNIERSNKWPYPDTLAKLAKAPNIEVYIAFSGKSSAPSRTNTRSISPVQKGHRCFIA